MRFKLILSLVGMMIILCGLCMAVPMAVDFFLGYREDAGRFAVAAGVTVAVGTIVTLMTGVDREPLRTKEMFLSTTLIWLAFAAFAALPYFVSPYQVSVTDALFEAMSGLTTTGATIFNRLDTLSPGILLWRAMTQWMGGLGIIILVILILPALHIGGMQFFNTESSAQSERQLATVSQNMQAILSYFIGLTVACIFCFYGAGMSFFDAVCHAMATVASGGFSTHDASIAYFNSPAIEWIAVFFMVVSGLPLILGLYLFRRKWRLIRNDAQIGLYLNVLLIATVVLTFVRWGRGGFHPDVIGAFFRESAFMITSIVSTTGFTLNHYQSWGPFAVTLFIFLLMVGGCTGSTSGGIKIFRFSVLRESIGVRLKRLIQPHGVFVARYGERPITDEVLISVLVFLGFFAGTAVVSTLALSLCGLDFTTALSTTLACIGNVGIWPDVQMSPDLPQTATAFSGSVKWILMVVMMVGRLEFATVFVLFFPFLWRRNA